MANKLPAAASACLLSEWPSFRPSSSGGHKIRPFQSYYYIIPLPLSPLISLPKHNLQLGVNGREGAPETTTEKPLPANDRLEPKREILIDIPPASVWARPGSGLPFPPQRCIRADLWEFVLDNNLAFFETRFV